jgi:hypothetical protein
MQRERESNARGGLKGPEKMDTFSAAERISSGEEVQGGVDCGLLLDAGWTGGG